MFLMAANIFIVLFYFEGFKSMRNLCLTYLFFCFVFTLLHILLYKVTFNYYTRSVYFIDKRSKKIVHSEPSRTTYATSINTALAKETVNENNGQSMKAQETRDVFEGINAIWFLVACSDFDQTLREDDSTNRLQEAVDLFGDVWQSRFLLEAGIIVFLNKQDILQWKVSQGRSIQDYFPQYQHFQEPGDEYTRVKLFIRSLFTEITTKKRERKHLSTSAERFVVVEASRPRECYFHFTTATDTDNIKTVFKDVHQMILTHILNNVGLY